MPSNSAEKSISPGEIVRRPPRMLRNLPPGHRLTISLSPRRGALAKAQLSNLQNMRILFNYFRFRKIESDAGPRFPKFAGGVGPPRRSPVVPTPRGRAGAQQRGCGAGRDRGAEGGQRAVLAALQAGLTAGLFEAAGAGLAGDRAPSVGGGELGQLAGGAGAALGSRRGAG